MSPNHHLIFRETKTEFRSAVVLILKRQGHDLKSVVWIFRPMHLCRKQNWQQLQRYNLFFLAKMWEAKINEALLFKVTSRRAVEWRDYSWATASVCVCVCVCARAFQAIMLGEMWKTQSPPVSMETPSLSQAERQSPSSFRIRGVNYSTLFSAYIITLCTIDRWLEHLDGDEDR